MFMALPPIVMVIANTTSSNYTWIAVMIGGFAGLLLLQLVISTIVEMRARIAELEQPQHDAFNASYSDTLSIVSADEGVHVVDGI